MAIDDLSLTDPAFFATGDPYAIWAEMRLSDPVHWTRSRLGQDYWSITRHADLQFVFKNHDLFSSRLSGASLPPSPEAADPVRSEHARLQRAGAMLVTCDAPRHGKMRRAFDGPFLPKAVSQSASTVREIAAKLIDEALEMGECDFVKHVAGPLPLAIIFRIMGIPETDWPMLFRFASMHATPDDPDVSIGSALETRAEGLGGMMRYCRDAALDRRRTPRDDLLTTIALAEIDGERLSDDEVGFNGQLLIVGGQETTRNSISSGIREIALRSGYLEKLRETPAWLQSGPDEMVRWASPIVHNMRTATRDVELGGKIIREGDWVVLWIPSANRDEDVFADAERFDLSRRPNPHLAFGYGPHFCLGAFLARLEMRTVLELFAERVGAIELTGDVTRTQSITFTGFKAMPVRLTRRAAAHSVAA